MGVLESIWTAVSDNSPALQTVFISLSAIAAFIVIARSSRISKREKTIEIVYNTFFGDKESSSYKEFKNLIIEIEEQGRDIAEYWDGGLFHEPGKRDILLRQTNQYELVSLGVRQGVFDESFYKRWFFSQLTKDYNKLLPFITRIREKQSNDAYFCEFERLALRWSRKRHPVKHPPKWKVAWWSLTGQFEKVRRAVDAETC